jgi:hypothetical protein
MMQSSLQLRHFAWSVPYFIQWHAVIHVLDTLRADPFHLDAVKAWRLIDSLYENNSKLLLSTNRPILMAVGNLCLKAFSARAAALTKEGRRAFHPPEYIIKLREQREVAKTRINAVIATSKGQEVLDGKERLVTADVDATWSDTNPRSAGAMVEAQPKQCPVSQPPTSYTQGSAWTRDDTFWLSDALRHDSFAGGTADMMHRDTDAILAQDYCHDTPNGEVIDWAQWDAWLGNLDSVHSNAGAGSR